MISLDAIRAAAARIAGAVEQTPFLHSRTLSRLTGAELFLKFENLQFTASFKERGALNKLLSLAETSASRGVIAMSAGNHAQARRLPRGAPRHPGDHRHAEGLADHQDQEHARARRHRRARRRDAVRRRTPRARARGARRLVFVHPYEDPLIIAGQGTVGLEMLERDARPRHAGRPGRRRRPDLRHRDRGEGAQSRRSAIYRRRVAHLPVDAPAPRRRAGSTCGGDTIAEGIAVKDVGDDRLRDHQKDCRGRRWWWPRRRSSAPSSPLIEIEKTVAEGAGAAALAALLEHRSLSPASASASRSRAATSTAACSPRC